MPARFSVDSVIAVAKAMKPITAPIARKMMPLAMSTRERRGVTSSVDVIVMCRNSPVMATIPRMSTKIEDEPAAPMMFVT